MRAAFTTTGVLLIVVVGALCVFAQDHCDAPRAFECRINQIDPSKQWEVRAHYAYDDDNRRISVLEEVSEGNDESFHVIDLFKEKKRYVVSLKTKKCKVEDLDHEWRRFGVPPNAKFRGEAQIGTDAFQDGGVLVNMWHDHDENHFWFGTFTAHGCIPVDDGFRGNNTGFIHTNFYDVSLGISDPNIFFPPSQCKH
jgi:hypothetical protein